jgi:two-component system cell cycle sensor histidine kinase/response regulator CckA
MPTIFASHGMCVMWNSHLILLSVITDGLVALSYYSILAALFALMLKKKGSVPLRPWMLLFGLFIAFCGAGQVMDIISIWKPIYWLKGFWNAGTAVTSVATAFILIPKVAGFIKLPETAAQLEREKVVLQERHGILQTVLNSVSDGILLTDPAGKLLAHNPASDAILGEKAPAGWKGGNGETIIRGRTIEHTVQEVRGLGLVHVLRDVTEKRRSEELRLRLEGVIATMKQGFAIVTRNEDGNEADRIEATNPAMERMFGGVVEGFPAENIFSGSGKERAATFGAIREAAEAEGFWEGETLCESLDGRKFPSMTRVNTHHGARGPFVSLLFQDISAQKQMLRETEELQAKLAQSQKLHTLGVLAGGVAHDFNNLLTGIMGNASLALHSMYKDVDKADVGGLLKDVITASARAADLTRQLLAYAGKGQIATGPVDITELAAETASLVRATIPKNVEVRLDLQKDLPLIEGDAGQLQPIIMNLAINASEAIGDSVGLVEIVTSECDVKIEDGEVNQLGEPLPAGKYVCLNVRDNGSGMSEETLSHIFDPFFTTKFTGRGLGLSAVSGIVRSHGGNISVNSKLGSGSNFRILFPALQRKKVERIDRCAHFNLYGSGAILVVDDEEMVRRTASVALRHYGYEVLLAENGKRALEILELAGPRLKAVILDTTMPVMSGAETLAEIRRMWPSLTVVMTSGFTLDEAMKRFRESGIAGFVQKPFTAQALAEAVKEAING